jgi:hypothetical protein
MHPGEATAWALTAPGPTQYLTKLPSELTIQIGGYLSERDACRLMITGRNFCDPILKRQTITDIRMNNNSSVRIDFSKPRMRDLFGYRNLSISNLTPSSTHQLNTATDLTELEFAAHNHKLSEIYNLFFLPNLEQLTLTGKIRAGADPEREKATLESLRGRWENSPLDCLQLGEYNYYGINKTINFDLTYILDKLPLRLLDLGACYIGQDNDQFRANFFKALPSLAQTLEDLTINTEGVFSDDFAEFTKALMTLKKLQELSIMNREGNNLTSEDFGRLGLALSHTQLEKLVCSFQECPNNMIPAYLLNLPPTVKALENALIGDVGHPEHIDTVITALGRLPLLTFFSNESNSHLTPHGAIRIANFLLNKESINSVEIVINDSDGPGEDDPEVDEQITFLKKAFMDAGKKLHITFA